MYSVKVATKIAKVMGQIEYLKKDGRVEFGVTKYNYLSEAKITQQIREKTLEVGLVIIPTECKVIELPNQSEAVEMEYAIIDIESGEDIKVRIAGKGQDKGDKSMYKAMTGAYKYMQRQTFAIPTGDDPDKISSDEMEEEIKKDNTKKNEEAKHLAEFNKLEENNQKLMEAALSGVESNTVGGKSPKNSIKNQESKDYSEAQKVYILANKKGFSSDQVKEFACKAFKMEVASLSDLNTEQLATIKKRLEAYPDKSKGGK
jgi:hypothetical protein